MNKRTARGVRAGSRGGPKKPARESQKPARESQKPARKSGNPARQSGTPPRQTVSVNPATGEVIAKTPHTDPALFPEIFARAREAQKNWGGFSFRARKKHILRMRDYIVDNAEELSRTVSDDNGKTLNDALITDVIASALAADWYGRQAGSVLRPRRVPRSSLLFLNKSSRLLREPLGVVGIISPWNYPLSIPFGETVMGLMAGNAILLKTAADTVTVGRAIEKIVAAGELPPGLFAHLIGSGSSIAAAFFQLGVAKIFFTGSTGVGKILMRQAADTMTPLSLELGGKDPMIVLADADLERAANGAAWAGYQNAGQSCGAVERIFVQEKVYESFLKLLARKTTALRHGAGDFASDIGSMTNREQLSLVDSHVRGALKKGAHILAQSRPGVTEKGFFYPATLMVNVDPTTPLQCEETFGPILPVQKFRDVEEAVRLANDSSMGLTASIWTGNLKLGRRLAARLETGVVTINDHLYTHGLSELPWGGIKESGIGRTHSALGLEEMTRPKLINWEKWPVRRNAWWYPLNRESYRAMLAVLRLLFPRSVPAFFRDLFRALKYVPKKMLTRWDPG